MDKAFKKGDQENSQAPQNYAYQYQVDTSIETGINADQESNRQPQYPQIVQPIQNPHGNLSGFVHNLGFGNVQAPGIFQYNLQPQQSALQLSDRYEIKSRNPVLAKCTSCGVTGQTKVTLSPGIMTYATLILQTICFLFACFPLCCLGFWPLFWNELKDSIHSCQSCNAIIAKVNRHKFTSQEHIPVGIVVNQQALNRNNHQQHPYGQQTQTGYYPSINSANQQNQFQQQQNIQPQNTPQPFANQVSNQIQQVIPQNPYESLQRNNLLDGRMLTMEKQPFLAKCNHCNRQSMTVVKRSYGPLNYIIAGFLSPCCCWIPFQGQCQGRDKFCKAIQYGSRFIMWHQLARNDKLAGNFKGLFEGMRDARKLFRLFKSLMEYQKIQQLLKQKGPQHKQALNILSRLGFFFYWIFDNLQILSKVKYLDQVDKEKAGKRAAFFWFIALIFGLLLVIIQMYEATLEEADLRQKRRQAAGDEKTLADLGLKYGALQRKKVDNILNLLKTLGDLVTATQALGLPKKLFGFDFNDGHVGLGGLTSAVITCYQLFPSAPRK